MESHGVVLGDIRLNVLVILETCLVENGDAYGVSVTCSAKQITCCCCASLYTTLLYLKHLSMRV